MSAYLLGCDEQTAQKHIDCWLADPKFNITNLAIPQVQIVSVGSANEPHVLLSLQFRPLKGTRISCLTFLLLGLAPCLVIPLGLVSLIEWTAKEQHVLGYLVLLFWLGTAFSPLLTLGLGRVVLRFAEILLIQKIVEDGKTVQSLVIPSHWILFPGDVFLIQAGISVYFFVQFIGETNLLGLIPFFVLLSLFVAPYGLVVLTRAYANREALNTFNLQTYWKLAVTKSTGNMRLLFYEPVMFYALLYLCTLLEINQVYGHFDNLSMTSIGKTLGNVDVSKILRDTHDLEHTISYAVTHFNGPEILSFPNTDAIIILLGAISLLIYYFFGAKTVGSMTADNWNMRKLSPGSDASKFIRRSQAKMTNVHLITNLCYLLWQNIICLCILLVAAIWMFHLYIGWLPASWIAPIVLLQVEMETIFGQVAGEIITYLLLLGIFSPPLLWLLMCLYSLIKSVWHSVTGILRLNPKRHRAQAIMDALCKQLGIAPPLVRIDNTTASWPKTMPLLPSSRFCIVDVSNALLGAVTDEQLRLILAHELAHVTRHVRELWCIQLLSRVSLLGPGYLTLLVDYWTLEVEADGFAIHITKERQAFLHLLEELEEIEKHARTLASEALKRRRRSQPQNRTGRRISLHLSGWITRRGIVQGVGELYKFHFGDSLWGSLHPSTDERLMRLRSRLDLLTERAQKVLGLAEEEAQRFKHTYIGTEHLLLGLIREDKQVTLKVLSSLSVDLNQVRSAVEFILNRGDQIVLEEIGLTPSAQKVIELAVEEAHHLNQDFVGPEHLMLALVREGIVARVLEGMGVHLEQA